MLNEMQVYPRAFRRKKTWLFFDPGVLKAKEGANLILGSLSKNARAFLQVSYYLRKAYGEAG